MLFLLVLLGRYPFDLMKYFGKPAWGIEAGFLRNFCHAEPAPADQFFRVPDTDRILVLGKSHSQAF